MIFQYAVSTLHQFLCICFNIYCENGQLCVIIDLLVSRVVVVSGLENSFKDFLES